MPIVGVFQSSVREIEGFDIRVVRDGRDVRDDKQLPVGYARYSRAMSGGSTVTEWRVGRFARVLPEYEVEVLNARGRPVHGGTLLSTVRATYR
jgi:hypothetical protein